MTDSAIRPIQDWSPANRRFYADFQRWLREGGYSDTTISRYSSAARLALGLLEKPYPLIDLQADLERVRACLAGHIPNPATRADYFKGLAKLEGYLRYRCGRPAPEQPVNWDYYLGSLPDWLADDVRAYLAHRRRAWHPDRKRRATIELLSHLTQPLRWMASRAKLTAIGDLIPALWFDYVDHRLAKGIQARTINRELYDLQDFLRFLAEGGRPACESLLDVKPLKTGRQLPRDVPAEQLRPLLREIEAEATSAHATIRRQGRMDRAWCLLMLHSGLRTGEVRRLRLGDLDLESRLIRVEQSKGLQDRVVCLSPDAVDALRAYLEVRGEAASDHLFIYRHRRLSSRYCGSRLRTYGRRCGVRVTPHQLRYSAATLLLNAGASILTVQAILGHQHVDTTLGYARLYDGTLAAHHYRAIGEVERCLGLMRSPRAPHRSLTGQLLALGNALSAGTLSGTVRRHR